MEYKFGDSSWHNTVNLSNKSFICWNCNNGVASNSGYKTHKESSTKKIFICPHCGAPNIYDINGKTPLSPLPGKDIEKLPENLNEIYNEIRTCMQNNSFTAAIMLMRKIIMNIAVHEGADKNLKFVQYVDYLCDNGIVHKKSKKKAESVKNLGNDANHEIESRTKEEAQNCLEFIELLLMANYEFADEEVSSE